MATLNGLTYEATLVEDTSSTTHTINFPTPCYGIIIGIASTTDPYGTCTIGGVTITASGTNSHFGREMAMYYLFGTSAIDARTNDTLTLGSMSGVKQIITVAFGQYNGASATTSAVRTYVEDDGWASITNVDTTFADPGAGSVVQVALWLGGGEASTGGGTHAFDSTTGASSVEVGKGGDSDTGVVGAFFMQGPDESTMNVGYAVGADQGVRFWSAIDVYLAYPTDGPLNKYGLSPTGV